MTQKFWSRFAPLYNVFMRKDQKAYEKMYVLIRETIKGREVLELATGTGMIAKQVAEEAAHMIATDYSEGMIAQARKGKCPTNLRFEIADAVNLQYEDSSFDVVLISNALHIMPNPEKALDEIRRVLKPEGILIAPTFTHGGMGKGQKMLAVLMEKTIGFKPNSAWSKESYVEFLHKNGWKIQRGKCIQASFPLTYVECVRMGSRKEKSDLSRRRIE